MYIDVESIGEPTHSLGIGCLAIDPLLDDYHICTEECVPGMENPENTTVMTVNVANDAEHKTIT